MYIFQRYSSPYFVTKKKEKKISTRKTNNNLRDEFIEQCCRERIIGDEEKINPNIYFKTDNEKKHQNSPDSGFSTGDKSDSKDSNSSPRPINFNKGNKNSNEKEKEKGIKYEPLRTDCNDFDGKCRNSYTNFCYKFLRQNLMNHSRILHSTRENNKIKKYSSSKLMYSPEVYNALVNKKKSSIVNNNFINALKAVSNKTNSYSYIYKLKKSNDKANDLTVKKNVKKETNKNLKNEKNQCLIIKVNKRIPVGILIKDKNRTKKLKRVTFNLSKNEYINYTSDGNLKKIPLA